jgi:membrane associated rhomboid family serine protease
LPFFARLDFAAICASILAMLPRTKSGDYEPVGWIGGRALYASTLLVAAHLVTMLACAVVMMAGRGAWLVPLAFDSEAVTRELKLWQLVSYVFLHVPDGGQYYIWFALEMFFLFAFGREVERFLGRSAFLKMYALLVLLPVLALSALGFALPMFFAGSAPLHLAVFVAFAALYPDAEMLFAIPAKWLAALITGAAAMQAAVFHNWPSLLVLCISAGTAVVFVGHERSADWLDFRRLFAVRKAAPVPRRLPRRAAPPEAEMEDPAETIDALLDKIAAHGMESLTPEERDRLEKARQALLRKG